MKNLFLFSFFGIGYNLFAGYDLPAWTANSYSVISDTYNEAIPPGYCVIKGKFLEAGTKDPIPYSIAVGKPSDVGAPADTDGLFSLQIPTSDTAVYFYNTAYGEVIFAGPFKNRHMILIEIYLTETPSVAFKPVIYAYNAPDDFLLSLKPKGNFTFTYPVSKDGTWHLKTNSNGTLTDCTTRQNYPYIFWEGEVSHLSLIEDKNTVSGYLIKTDTSVSFLENTLAAYGLNEKESTDFITFWGPRLVEKPYAVIQFLSNQQYGNTIAELSIMPAPESLLRLYMYMLPLDSPASGINLAEPEIPGFQRSGFTVIEWGGSVIKQSQVAN